MASWQRQLRGRQRDAAAALTTLFESFGLGSLAGKIIRYTQQGYAPETMMVLLQETKEYRTRFAANEARIAKGLPVLSPGEYIETERAYARALQAAGMPQGFYDDPLTDFRKFLEQDIAPTEIAERAGRARELAMTVDATQRDILQRRLGLGVGDLAAHYLDTNRAFPLIEKQVQTTLLGAERERAGYAYSQKQADMLFTAGITVEQARQGYGAIAEAEPTFSKLSEIVEDDFGVEDLEAEIFGSSGEAARRRQGLASQERARFAGTSGTGTRTLTREDTFNR